MEDEFDIDEAVRIERDMAREVYLEQAELDSMVRHIDRSGALERRREQRHFEMLQDADATVRSIGGCPAVLPLTSGPGVNAGWVDVIVQLFREGAIADTLESLGHVSEDRIARHPTSGVRGIEKAEHFEFMRDRAEFVAKVTSHFRDASGKRRLNDHAGLMIKTDDDEWVLWNANDEFAGQSWDERIYPSDIPDDGFSDKPFYFADTFASVIRGCRMIRPTAYHRCFNDGTVQPGGDCYAISNAGFILWNYLSHVHAGSTRAERLDKLRGYFKRASRSGAPVAWICRAALFVMDIPAEYGRRYTVLQVRHLIGDAATVRSRCA